MAERTINIKRRIKTMKSILSEDVRRKFLPVFEEEKGDWTKVLKRLPEDLPKAELKEMHLAYSLADWSDDNQPLMERIVTRPGLNITDLRGAARNLSPDKLTEIIDTIDTEHIPDTISGETSEEKTKNYALHLNRKLYSAEPAAVLSRMAENNELPGMDNGLNIVVSKFLDNQPDFNIRTTSIYTALAKEDAFKDIADDQREKVADYVKKLSLVQTLSPVPEAVPHLLKHNLTSAVRITDMPEKVFLRNYGPTLGAEVARRVYNTAADVHIRNEHTLMVMREAVRGGEAMSLSGCCSGDRKDRMAVMAAMLPDRRGVKLAEGNETIPLSLENLFGDMDYCECDECLSVYSPAAYFVDLLQYLRHNNSGPDPANPDTELDPDKNIDYTPLGALFKRRPDLGCLELTCENTFTVLPYVDLVNEIMEHWVAENGPLMPSFNVEDETTSELLAQPQHTNYRAYCILKNAVYPFSLPYHQAIDVARIWLDYMGTSRYELLDTFRRNNGQTGTSASARQCRDVSQDCVIEAKCPSETVSRFEAVAQDRAVDAEYLGITQEEYIILTREAFWSKEYFEHIHNNQDYTPEEYQKKIGVRDIHEYYGYDNKGRLKDLTFVKEEFLPRTGIQYTDLVELLKTRWINPQFPKGKALKILESIRFSYRFMQQKVDENALDPYAELVQWLEAAPQIIAYADSVLHPEYPCGRKKKASCIEKADIRQWVECYFERLGELIVLESGEGPYLPVEGGVYRKTEMPPSTVVLPDTFELVGILYKNGEIRDKDDKIIGFVGCTFGFIDQRDIGNSRVKDIHGNDFGIAQHVESSPVMLAAPVLTTDGTLLVNFFSAEPLLLIDSIEPEIIVESEINLLGYITKRGLEDSSGVPSRSMLPRWKIDQDSCNLEKVRLVHLNGTPLAAEEYDRIQRFIRLWQRTGWTIDETDKALIGLAAAQDADESCTEDECGQQQYIDFDAFTDTCEQQPGQDDTGDCGGTADDDFDCPELLEPDWTISPELLHQLVAVKKLVDRTGLDLPKLLTFWADISTGGEKPLYARLFLTHNLLGMDKVFQADEQGNFLTGDEKITDHLPVLMAALRLKADDISTIMAVADLPDALTLNNVSLLYRYSLLAKLLRVKAALLPDVISLFGNPFASAEQMLELLDNWTRMEDAGFSFAQLNYFLQDTDDSERPLAPSAKTVLQLAKTLYDGLKAIDDEHPDLKEEDGEQADAEFVRSKAGLLFEQEDVTRIIDLLEGSTVYTTNAPSGLTVTLPDELVGRMQYKDQPEAVPPRATLQVTGILTAENLSQAQTASAGAGWADALERIGRQTGRVISDVLFAVFPDSDATTAVLLAGDVAVPADQLDSGQPDPNTASSKRLFFLKHFLLFLRRQLAQRLIAATLSGSVGLDNDITEVLLSDILFVGGESAMTALERIKDQPGGGTIDWLGYLIPAVNGEYTLIALGDTQPAPITLDGMQITFPHQQEDPNNVWASDPVRLNSGRLYRLEVSGQPATALQWKTATSPRAPIPASMLLPEYSSEGTKTILIRLAKAAMLINGFDLNLDEVVYLHGHGGDFAGFDFNSLTLRHWLRVHAYTELRNSLAKKGTGLIELFRWAGQTGENNAPIERIVELTGWKEEQIQQLIAADHFDLDRPEAFCNEIALRKMQRAVEIADKVREEVDTLFNWANPSSKFSVCHDIAQDIQNALRSRYDQEDWEQVVKPLNDQLRENQKQALISYLLQQKKLQEWGVIDADGLFEYFLIDVQMSPCFETSRIKQAISSVQLFVQRCMLGLEEDSKPAAVAVPQNALDQGRWEWMKRYRVWEANRKVFLYPENWILSQLRDDKSPFYMEFESTLLQKDINQQTVEDALKSYLYKVDEVANLRVAGLFLEQEKESENAPKPTINTKLHIFARTRNAPYFFFYRFYDVVEGNWYPWEKVQVDIPSYDHETNGQIYANGTYLIPVVWQKRLLIFFPQFMKKTAPNPTTETKSFDVMAGEAASDNKPIEYWEIKMGWSEYRNGKWTQKQLSTEAIYDKLDTSNPPVPQSPLPDIKTYEFIPRIAGTDGKDGICIDIHGVATLANAFWFTGSQIKKGNKHGGFSIERSFHWDICRTRLRSFQCRLLTLSPTSHRWFTVEM